MFILTNQFQDNQLLKSMAVIQQFIKLQDIDGWLGSKIEPDVVQ